MAYPWVAPAIPPRIFNNFPSLDAPAGRLDPKQDRFIPAVQVDTLASAMPIVRESNGLSAAPLPLIQREVESGTFVSLPFRAPWLRLNYGFIYLRDRSLSPAARAFMTEVRAVEAELKKRLASENATRAVTRMARPQNGRSRCGDG